MLLWVRQFLDYLKKDLISFEIITWIAIDSCVFRSAAAGVWTASQIIANSTVLTRWRQTTWLFDVAVNARVTRIACACGVEAVRQDAAAALATVGKIAKCQLGLAVDSRVGWEAVAHIRCAIYWSAHAVVQARLRAARLEFQFEWIIFFIEKQKNY